MLSIVTGTFNRRPHLQTMLTHTRLNIPHGIAYEIIIVDGGSTDGTPEWCAAQSDVKLIQHGELRGAIAAFTDGAKAASGDYVLLANDDIAFMPGSIMRALVHLEQKSNCGAVAFEDNRIAPGYEHIKGFKVQEMQVQRDGQPFNVPYAQVGLFRRWLGDICDWWGADDPDFPGHTYGGDNYLSARIWEAGYTVDAVEGARVKDGVVDDELRQNNYKIEKQNPAAYYKRYPQPPLIRHVPQLDNPQQEQLRTLYLPIFERAIPEQRKHKRGLREALARRGLVYEIDYVNERYNLLSVIDEFRPHLILMQCHAPTSISQEQLAAARQRWPQMVVVNWNGDVYEELLTSADMLEFLRHVDLQLTVNANVLPVYRQQGIPAAYWQVGFEPVDYDNLPDEITHDVVFLANAYNTLNDGRKKLGQILQSMPGVNVGIYGLGWQHANGACTYDFPRSTALYANAKIAIGDNQWINDTGFVSNRIFEVLASGGFLLHQRVNGLQELTGLVAGEHYIEWEDADDLQRKIKKWLGKRYDKKRDVIAAAGRAFAHEHHNFDSRVDELFDVLLPKLIEGDRDAV
jgi:glycosyltransferase involved in cell wall biosynthesis